MMSIRLGGFWKKIKKDGRCESVHRRIPFDKQTHIPFIFALPVAYIDNLARFNPGLSHQIEPSKWLLLNVEHVLQVAQLIIQQESVIGTLECNKIYPVCSISYIVFIALTIDNPNLAIGNKRLTLYTLARIISCSNSKKISSLTDLLEVWKTWETWDNISALANHQNVKDYLMDCLTHVGDLHGTRDRDREVKSILLHMLSVTFSNDARWKDDMTVLDHILTIDAAALDALLLEAVTDPQCRLLLKRNKQEVQSLLNLLQAVSLIKTISLSSNANPK